MSLSVTRCLLSTRIRLVLFLWFNECNVYRVDDRIEVIVKQTVLGERENECLSKVRLSERG